MTLSGPQTDRGDLTKAVLVTATALVAATALILTQLRAFEWNPALYLHAGSEGSAVADYVEDRLGPVPLGPGLGHDGKYFFVQAHDPLLLDRETIALLDRPTYRGQRMLYPLLAAPALALGDAALAWTMLLINLVALAVGTWIMARLAAALGKSPWLGLAVGLNIGLWFEIMIDGGGLIAWTLAVAGIYAVIMGRIGWATGFFVAAVLAREVMLIVPVGVFVYLWRFRHQREWGIVLGPIAAVLLWAAWVRVRAGEAVVSADSSELGLPLRGLLGAAVDWGRDPADWAVGALVTGAALYVVIQAVTRPSILSYAVVGFALLAVVLTEQVWLHSFDVSRAAAPLLTGFVLLAFTRTSTIPSSWHGDNMSTGRVPSSLRFR